jgi:hypothetical protein
MDFKFKAEVLLELEHTKGDATSKHKGTSILLLPYLPLEREKYVGRGGELTQDGCHVMMRALTAGLSATIHYAHEKGFIDSAENLRKVIHQLEQEFIAVPTIVKGEMPES